jgi:hypothetical protein
MPKPIKPHKQQKPAKLTRPVEQGLPDASDLKIVDALPGGPAPKGLHGWSAAFVDLIAAPAMQARLQDIAPQLAAFYGCNVPAGLQRVAETRALILVGERVQNAYVRVRQRIVENNRWLREFQTHLAHAQSSAAPDSPVALGLAQMVARRSAALGVNAAAKTRARKQRAKAKAPAKP